METAHVRGFVSDFWSSLYPNGAHLKDPDFQKMMAWLGGNVPLLEPDAKRGKRSIVMFVRSFAPMRPSSFTSESVHSREALELRAASLCRPRLACVR